MIRLTIDNHHIEVAPGTTVWQAAKSIGIDIPAMCYMEETGHITSCMVCLVKNLNTGHLFASCSTPVADGQIIVTNDQEVSDSHRTALELLLSEHVGDCEAPCQLVCPAHMNIPLMNRLIAKGDYAMALQVVKRDIALPSILGRICPAPCEAACRRKQVDEAVSICYLKGFVGEVDLNSPLPYRPFQAPPTGKRVAIIGAGPAGLSAAFYLQLKGHQSVIFEKSDRPGGMLCVIEEDTLPKEILRKEIKLILETGIQLKLNQTIDDLKFTSIYNEFDAIVLATGSITEDSFLFGLGKGSTGILADKLSFATSLPRVFAIGNTLRPSKMAIRSVGQGKEVATIIDHFLTYGNIQGYPVRFNSKFGRLMAEEFDHYLLDAAQFPRQIAEKDGFLPDAAIMESKRCMHCDCRNPETCKLREYSDYYEADQKRFNSGERKPVEKLIHREGIVYEPAKCIKCGICVTLTRQHQEAYGLTFIGRGFDVKVGVPFNHEIQVGLQKTAFEVANTCPTGALAMFDKEEQLE